MKKIIISDSCVASGICVMMSEFLEEMPNGKAAPKEPGIITDQQAEKFTEVINACPVGAISLQEWGLVKSKGKAGIEELKKLILSTFENYKIQKPSSDTYRFRSREFTAPIPSAAGENSYDYKSYDKAEQAGLREFDRVMYSQRRAIIQQILVEFKHSKLKPFNCYEEQAGNFYYDRNKEIEKSLKEFMTEAMDKTENKISFPDGFENFQPKLDFGDRGSIPIYQFRNIEKMDLVDTISNRLESLSSYRAYVNTDDIDYDDRYMCSYNLREVMQTFGSDLVSETADVVNDFLDYSMQHAIDEFNRAVQNELKEKINGLIKELDNIGTR